MSVSRAIVTSAFVIWEFAGRRRFISFTVSATHPSTADSPELIPQDRWWPTSPLRGHKQEQVASRIEPGFKILRLRTLQTLGLQVRHDQCISLKNVSGR